MITHIVFFKIANQSVATREEALAMLLSMNGKIAQLRSLEAGMDVIHSERSYDVALITRFDSLEDLQDYQVHPYHADVVAPFMKSVSSSVVAVDFFSDIS